MKTKVLLAFFLQILVFTAAVTGCAPQPPVPTATPIPEPALSYQTIQPADALKLLEDNPNAILLDVRTQQEYEEIRIPGSTLLPVDQIASEAPTLLPDKEAPIVVYCRSGNRSKTASKALLEMGYQNVYDLGGITNWPYETTSGK